MPPYPPYLRRNITRRALCSSIASRVFYVNARLRMRRLSKLRSKDADYSMEYRAIFAAGFLYLVCGERLFREM